MIAIIISIIALIVASLAYFKARRATKTDLRYKYIKDGIIVYDNKGEELIRIDKL